LKNELQAVLDNNIIHGGEYQINDGIKQMMQKGMKFVPGKVDEWMDCGNKDVTVDTNNRMLGFLHNDGEHLVDYDVKLENSNIIPPCYIGKNVVLTGTRDKDIIELLYMTKFTDGDELVQIAKGKYEYPSTLKVLTTKIKDKFKIKK
jgi:hypothetical protein